MADMNPALIGGVGILVLLFVSIYAVGVKLIGWGSALVVYGLTAAILAVTGLASYLINVGTQ